jgi:hypothetical protein
MATVRVRIVILTVRITLYVCPFNRMAHTANNYCKSPNLYYEIGNMSWEHSSLTTDPEPTSTDVEDHYEFVLSVSRSSRQDPAHLESNHNTLYALGPLQEKQYVSSARETLSLQGRGLKQTRAYLNDHRHASNSSNRGPTKSTSEPHVYGLDRHTSSRICGAPRMLGLSIKWNAHFWIG